MPDQTYDNTNGLKPEWPPADAEVERTEEVVKRRHGESRSRP